MGSWPSEISQRLLGLLLDAPPGTIPGTTTGVFRLQFFSRFESGEPFIVHSFSTWGFLMI